MGQITSQWTCSNCGTLNPVGNDFCANCGFSLTGTLTGTVVSDAYLPTLPSGAGRRATGGLGAGALIGARYQVVRLLGRGGFGAVYLATDNRFPARRVAVKEMEDARFSTRERVQAIARFQQEADLLSRLQHPNLPAVSDFLEEGGKAYLVMDFIEGQTLEEVQKMAGGPLDETRVLGWAVQICAVVSYLHGQPQPIIFRDLKPSNAMLTPTGQIKLIDFGIARIFRSDARKDTHELGSQGYAAPEQYGLEQTDARTDIYALGALLYTLLTNAEPLASFTRVVNPGSLIPPRQLNLRLSSESEQVILTAMQVEKRARYQSAQEMAAALSRVTAALSGGGSAAQAGSDALTFANTQPGSYRSQAPTQIRPAGTSGPFSSPTVPPASPFLQPTPATSGTMGQITVASVQSGGATIPMPTQPATPVPASPSFVPAQSGGLTIPMPMQPATPVPASAGTGASGRPLAPGTQAGGSLATPGKLPQVRQVPRRTLLVGGAIALAGAAGLYFIFRPGTEAASGTVTVKFAYSTEKAVWLKSAVNAFNASSQKLGGNGKVIQVQLSDLGSVDSVEQILNGQLKPVAWSPASNLEVNRLVYEWQKKYGNSEIVSNAEQFQPRSLVKSPLVLASWRERAQLLLKHYNVSTLDWDTLAQALKVANWAQLGGQTAWNQVTFGQTLPTQSNSGLLTITLLSDHHYQDERTLTTAQVAASACWDYLNIFEGAVNAFGHSSGTYLANDVIGNGPSQADVIATYENLVLTLQSQAQSRWQQPLLIYYPPINLAGDHPFVVLQGDWSNDEEKQAALQFRDFLLSTPQQIQALQNGFRPVNTSVALQDTAIAGNPFVGLAALFPGGRPDPLLAQAQEPSGDVVDALITGWGQHYPAPATTDG